MITRVRGNRISFSIALQKKTLSDGSSTVSNYVLEDGDVATVKLYGAGEEIAYTTTVEGNVLSFIDNGVLGVGRYDLELCITTAEGYSLRYAAKSVLSIIEYNPSNSSCEESCEFDGEDSVALEADFEESGAVTVDGVSEATVKTMLTAYLTKTEAASAYQPKGNYLTAHQSLDDYLKSADAASVYQPKGNYLTTHQSLDGYLRSSDAAQIYQPKGNYLIAHQDISSKADKEEIVTPESGTATIEPNKFYRFDATETIDITLAVPTDTTHVNHYHFSFTATDSTSLVVPASVIWQGGVEPPRTSGNVYEVSIVDNCASFLEFIPYDD